MGENMLFFLEIKIKVLVSILLSFIFSFFINKKLIKHLTKRKIFNTVRSEIASSKKEQTPLFGGLSFLISLHLCLIIIDYHIYLAKDILILILVSSIYFILGFIDDYLKVYKHNYKGLNALIRTLFELFSIFIFLKYFYIDNLNPLSIHLFNGKYIYIGSLIFILVPLIIYGGSNAINLTDGMDGLLTYLYLFSLLPLIFICLINAYYNFLIYLFSLYGALLAFLRFNLYPAKIFMGDTGSLYLGSTYLIICFLLRSEYLIPISSLIYIIEAISVIIQVISFQLFHKRVFKMTPIHHHFKLSGVSEYKIVFIFTLIGLFSLILSLGVIL